MVTGNPQRQYICIHRIHGLAPVLLLDLNSCKKERHENATNSTAAHLLPHAIAANISDEAKFTDMFHDMIYGCLKYLRFDLETFIAKELFLWATYLHYAGPQYRFCGMVTLPRAPLSEGQLLYDQLPRLRPHSSTPVFTTSAITPPYALYKSIDVNSQHPCSHTWSL